MTSAVIRGGPARRRPSTARIAVLTAGLLGLLGAYLVATVTHADAAETILSQGKPVTVSSVEWAGTPASAAVDGNTGTRWSSAFAAAQWIQVDLGAPAAISRIALNWEAAYAKAFSVQLSTDGATYTQVYSTTTGPGGQQSIPVTGTARYVKLNLTQRALEIYGYSLWEFQVFGGGSSP